MQPECLVCRRRGHGNHFGVSSCRACAAFFRRSIVKRRTYQCRRGNGMCSISQSDKIICRQCRLQKCIAVGMTPETHAI
ncbi:unnamed protein product [Nippostrongylus brasiliensis]|uniref:Nuclear hormone receptor,putative (inferred by orthology to a S. mansoni protein) n=1 Tax=Nippostrongylus brasiliensis TaxID=27835 RepID=A0A0N4YMF4_NIPBR|nr:unnamed protein product [Nippostrongylus brasiliensis]